MRALLEASKIFPQSIHILGVNRFIQFNEYGSTGFGDRLRGISLLLFVSQLYGIKKVFYQEKPSKAFPWKLSQLISIEGLDFITNHEASNKSKILEINHNCAKGTIIKKFGYAQMRRLRPSSVEVNEKLKSTPLDHNCLGLHIRTTDSAHVDGSNTPASSTISKILEAIKLAAKKHSLSTIYLSCDSLEARTAWERIVVDHVGLNILYNKSTSFDENQLRQTGAEDMLVDFFALSKCGYLIRSVPSEFSRFAALAGGLRLKYNQLEGQIRPN